MEIFGHLDYENLKVCRQVCPYWRDLIQNTSYLNDRFCYRLEFGRGFVVDRNQPPLSIILKSKIKIDELTFWCDFLKTRENVSSVEPGAQKLDRLFEILDEMNVGETVTDLTIQSHGDEPRTNALLFEILFRLKNVKALRFSLPAFVHVFETFLPTEDAKPDITVESIETVEIFHETFRRIIPDDFRRMLKIFPNTKQIEVYPSDAMLLNKNIIHEFAPLIKTITNLGYYTIKNITNVPELKLDRLDYPFPCECTRVLRYLREHPEIRACSLSMHYRSTTLDRPYENITELILSIYKLDETIDDHMRRVLRWTPNLEKLELEASEPEEHNFGHKTVELKKLKELQISKFDISCNDCFSTMLRSCVNVEELTLVEMVQHLSVKQFKAIADNLIHLKYLSISYDTVSSHKLQELIKYLILAFLGRSIRQPLRLVAINAETETSHAEQGRCCD